MAKAGGVSSVGSAAVGVRAGGGGPKISIGGGSRAELGSSSTGFSSRSLANFSSRTPESAGLKSTGPKTAKYGSHMSSGEFKGPKLDLWVRLGSVNKVDTGSAKRAEAAPKAKVMPESLIRTVRQPDATLGQLREPKVVVKGLEPKPFVPSKTENKTDSAPKPRGNSTQRVWTDAPRALDTTPKSRGISADTNRIVLPPPSVAPENLPVKAEQTGAAVVPKVEPLRATHVIPMVPVESQPVENTSSNVTNLAEARARLQNLREQSTAGEVAPPRVTPVTTENPVTRIHRPIVQAPSKVDEAVTAPVAQRVEETVADNKETRRPKTFQSVFAKRNAKVAAIRNNQAAPANGTILTTMPDVTMGIQSQTDQTPVRGAHYVLSEVVVIDEENDKKKRMQRILRWFLRKKITQTQAAPAQPEALAKVISLDAKRAAKAEAAVQTQPVQEQSQSVSHVPAQERKTGLQPKDQEIVLFQARMTTVALIENPEEPDADEEKAAYVFKPAQQERLQQLSRAITRLFSWFDWTSTQPMSNVAAALDPANELTSSTKEMTQGRPDGSDTGKMSWRSMLAKIQAEVTAPEAWLIGWAEIVRNPAGYLKKKNNDKQLKEGQIRKIREEGEEPQKLVA